MRAGGLAFLALAAFASADAPGRAPEWVAHVAQGPDLTGPLRRLQPTGAVEIAGDHPGSVDAKNLIRLRRAGAALPPFPQGPQLVLANGDHVPGTVQALTAETLRFRAACGEEREWKVPLNAVSLVWLATPEGAAHPEAFRRRLAAGQRKQDAIYLRNGDVLEGVVNSIEGNQLQIEVDQKEQTVDLKARVAVIAFGTELARLPPPKGQYLVAVLANGGRVSLGSAESDAYELHGTTLFGASLRVPLDQLTALGVRQGRAVYLSDLKPSRYEYTPFLDDRWPWVRDGSVLGRDLHLGGSVFDKGLGVHSASRLTFDLAGGYQRFEALVGLDDATGRGGSALVQVLVDGKPQNLDREAPLSASAPPRPIRVDVRGGRELTLVVGFGRGGHVQDHVDWADARLIR